MEQAVFLGSNFKKSQLENGIVWSTKFKTVTGQYVYAVDTYILHYVQLLVILHYAQKNRCYAFLH